MLTIIFRATRCFLSPPSRFHPSVCCQALEMFEDAERFFRRLPRSFYGKCMVCGGG